MAEPVTQVEKVLTRNDIGATGGHQAGIAVPKTGDMLEFFPTLDAATFNPRMKLLGIDTRFDVEFPLTYIYYNGKVHGLSSRNELRVTGLSAFFKRHRAEVGDSLLIIKITNGSYRLTLEKGNTYAGSTPTNTQLRKIQLTGQWSTYRKR